MKAIRDDIYSRKYSRFVCAKVITFRVLPLILPSKYFIHVCSIAVESRKGLFAGSVCGTGAFFAIRLLSDTH